MSFHTIDYLLFLPLVVAFYYATPARGRWALLLMASMAFYASWRIEFLPLLWTSILVDYYVAKALPGNGRKGKAWLLSLSLLVNLGLLSFFKFFGALSESFHLLFSSGDNGLIQPINLLLPLGISFYTFQTLGYVIDVYRGRREPEQHLGYFAVYVTFFPQLIAGPIERSGKLLPQLHARHQFSYENLAAGSALMLLGYFKKLVIADALPEPLGTVMSDPSAFSPLAAVTASIGTVYYYYADLSGYADIAIGTALILGIRLTQNFNRPFAAPNVTVFWQSWHVTVSRWFRDYVYLPIARRFGDVWWGRYWGLILTMLLIAIWHDASLNWLAAGLLAGLLLCMEAAQLKRSARKKREGDRGSQQQGGQLMAIANRSILWAFLTVMGALIAAESLGDAGLILARIGELPVELGNIGFYNTFWLPPYLLVMIAGLEIYQWYDAREPVFERLQRWPRVSRWGFYYALTFTILIFGIFESPDFLYFNF